MEKIQLAGIIPESIVDGPGIRFVIFSQGCPHRCAGCHNPETHDPNGGYESSLEEIFCQIRKNPILKGVTFSGGDPFMQAEPFARLARKIHQLQLDVVTYTGYTIEYLLSHSLEHNGWKELLEETDLLIDGPFILQQRTLLLPFRGSENQRIIDVQHSLKTGKIVEKEFVS